MAVDEVIGSITSGGGSAFGILIWSLVIGVFALILAGGGVWYWYSKKRWNLRVEVKLPRSGGKMIFGEWAKGFYNAKRGVVLIKRKGVKAVPMEVFDPKIYLQGSDLLTVIQVASEDYRPVLNDSWTEYKTERKDAKGKFLRDTKGNILYEKCSVLNIKIDSGLNKAWKSAWDAAAKKAYSLQTFMTQFQTPIAIGIVILSCFVGFAIIWTRLGSVCG